MRLTLQSISDLSRYCQYVIKRRTQSNGMLNAGNALCQSGELLAECVDNDDAWCAGRGSGNSILCGSDELVQIQ